MDRSPWYQRDVPDSAVLTTYHSLHIQHLKRSSRRWTVTVRRADTYASINNQCCNTVYLVGMYIYCTIFISSRKQPDHRVWGSPTFLINVGGQSGRNVMLKTWKGTILPLHKIANTQRTCRSQRPHGLRRGSAAARLLGLWVQILPGARICLLWVLCVARRLCVGLITHPEKSYRVWCVWVWSWILDNEKALAHWEGGGGSCCAVGNKWTSFLLQNSQITQYVDYMNIISL